MPHFKASVFKHSRSGKWTVKWREPTGKQRQKTFGKDSTSKKRAQRFAVKLEGELIEGTYNRQRRLWADWVRVFSQSSMAQKSKRHKQKIIEAIRAFERIITLKEMTDVTTDAIERFKTARLAEQGRYGPLSPATVNANLRCLSIVITEAVERDWLTQPPRIKMLKEPKRILTYVSSEEFSRIFAHCDAADLPRMTNGEAGDYWRAVLLFAFLTGWRISAIEAIRRDNLDMKTGQVFSDAESQKGKRDVLIVLPPVLMEYLAPVWQFEEKPLRWKHGSKTFRPTFHKIQRAAGVNRECRIKHECGPTCDVYGFHDLRRGFATENVDRFSARELQRLMLHRSFSTTEKYIQQAKTHRASAPDVHIPDLQTTPKAV